MPLFKEFTKKATIAFAGVVLCSAMIFRAENIVLAEEVDNTVYLGQRGLSNLFSLGFPQSRRVGSWNRNSGIAGAGRVWFRGFGNLTTSELENGNGDFSANGGGVTIGADRQIGRNFLWGGGIGGTWVSAECKTPGNSTDVSAIFGLIYGRIQLQRLYFDVEGNVAGTENKIGLRGANSYQYSSTQGGYGIESGTWWENGLAKIEPYIGLRQAFYDDRSESDGVKTTSVLGCRYSWKTIGKLAVVSPRLYAGWLHEWGDLDLINAAMFVDSPVVYRIDNVLLKKDRFFCGGGFTSNLGSSLDLYLRYTAEIASEFSAHTLLLGMNWNF